MSDQKARILIVDDEVHLAEGIADNLEAEGHDVTMAHDGDTGLNLMIGGTYDLVLLDVMMPKMDGFTVCETARARGSDTPVLFLTVAASTEDRIQGLQAGADDYLAKPFKLQELLLRVAAILRRRLWYRETPPTGSLLEFGENQVDFHSYQAVSWDGVQHALTQKEAMILKALTEKAGSVVSRERILDQVWGYDIYPSTRTIDNFIVRLRKRFERDPEHPQHIHTVRGVGYRWTLQPEATRSP